MATAVAWLLGVIRPQYGQRRMSLDELRRSAGEIFLFHYTDAPGADLAIDHRIFLSGTEARHGVGIYATDIAPVDEATLDEVITQCFEGSRSPGRVDHVIVVRREAGGFEFRQTSDPAHRLLSTEKLERIVAPELYVAAAIWTGEAWDLLDEGN